MSTNLLHRGYKLRIRAQSRSLKPTAVEMTDKTNTNRRPVLVIVCVAQFMVVLGATV